MSNLQSLLRRGNGAAVGVGPFSQWRCRERREIFSKGLL